MSAVSVRVIGDDSPFGAELQRQLDALLSPFDPAAELEALVEVLADRNETIANREAIKDEFITRFMSQRSAVLAARLAAAETKILNQRIQLRQVNESMARKSWALKKERLYAASLAEDLDETSEELDEVKMELYKLKAAIDEAKEAKVGVPIDVDDAGLSTLRKTLTAA
jgi:hypothetical protein